MRDTKYIESRCFHTVVPKLIKQLTSLHAQLPIILLTMARRDLGGLNGVCMCECMCVCLSHQISTQLNTYGRFWSGA